MQFLIIFHEGKYLGKEFLWLQRVENKKKILNR